MKSMTISWLTFSLEAKKKNTLMSEEIDNIQIYKWRFTLHFKLLLCLTKWGQEFQTLGLKKKKRACS